MTAPLHDPEDRLIGANVGRYRLVRRLGEGGMGAVYLGEREEDFVHRAAVKLLLETVPNDETARRFQAEKEALAAFRHANIVGLLDAGVTQAGIPYLIMDYVEGEPLDRYCRAHTLNLPARLRLILQLLDAVAAAHRRLIVHCDLKPSNVLVTADGAVQVLDFGIAKMLDPALYGFSNPLTNTFRPLTPEFASPEQLQGTPITTASDLYAIGVLLYAVLTGEHPFEDRVLQPVALLEAICFDAPEPPSRRAARLPQAPVAPKLLAGDLDAIVLKALAKEPDRRYRDADSFAADLTRLIDGLPVEARPDTWRYRAGKFARRKPAIAVAVAAAALAATAGAAGTITESIRANRARARAHARFADVRKLSNALLVEFYDKVGKLPGATPAQQLLVSNSVRYLDGLAAESRSDPALALELAEGFIKLASLQGSPYENNIGQPEESLTTIDKAVTVASAAIAGGAREPQGTIVLSKARQVRGDVLLAVGRIAESVEESRAAADLIEQILEKHPRDPEVLMQGASSHETLGDKVGGVGITSMIDRAPARRSYQRSAELYRRVIAIAPAITRPRRALVILQMKLADMGWDDDPPGSLAGYQDALRGLDQLPARELEELPNRRLRASLLRRIGESFGELNRPDEAVEILAEDVRLLDSILSIDPANERARWDLAIAINAQAEVETTRERHRAALPLYERVLQILTQTQALRHSAQLQLSYGETLIAIGRALTELGKPEDGAPKTREGLAVLRDLRERESGSTQALARIAHAFLTARPEALQDPKFALTCLDRAATYHELEPDAMLLRARALRGLKREPEALAVAAAALAKLPPVVPDRVYTSVNIRTKIEKFIASQ